MLYIVEKSLRLIIIDFELNASIKKIRKQSTCCGTCLQQQDPMPKTKECYGLAFMEIKSSLRFHISIFLTNSLLSFAHSEGD